MIFCTICSANHLPRVLQLQRALRRTQEIEAFIVCLVERDLSSVTPYLSLLGDVVLASELGIADFQRFMFGKSQYEACSALKPKLLRWIFDHRSGDYITFLDPDILVLSTFDELSSILRSAHIVVTPHFVHDDNTIETTHAMLRSWACGIFNSGFISLRRSESSLSFLDWWFGKVTLLCQVDTHEGLYCDQRWLDMALSFYDLTVLRHEGYNLGFWNIAERPVEETTDGIYLARGKPLRFIHFSTTGDDRDLYYFYRYLDDHSPLFELRERYLQTVAAFDRHQLAGLIWSYDVYESGEYISERARALVRPGSRLYATSADPFALSNRALEFLVAKDIRSS